MRPLEKDQPRRIQLWAPEIFAVGGIQAYSRHLLDALMLMPGVELTDVLTRNDERLPAGFDAPASTRFSLCGRNGASAGRLAFASALVSSALSRRPDLIITTHLFFAPLARLLRKIAGIPYWVVAHGVEAWGPIRARHQSALRSAERILAVSRFTRDQIIRQFAVEPSHVEILPNTVDGQRFQPEARSPELLARYGLASNQPVVLTVARLAASERYKGIDEMLSVWPEVQKVLPDAHYLILGEGDDRTRLEQTSKSLGLSAAVTFGGRVASDDLCAHYNLCDLFAMPSRGEGFGIVFLEALACGRPVLAGNQDGSVDPLRDGELGILIDPSDRGALRDAIVSVLLKRNPHPHLFQPEYLRQQVLAHFGIEQFRRTLTTQIDSYLSSQSKAD